MTRLVLLGTLLFASVALACSGEVCRDEAMFSTLDGGVPVNLQPLVLRNMWGANATNVGVIQVRHATTGAVTTQARVGVGGTVFVDAALVQGESYVLDRPSGCFGFGPTDGGLFSEPFTVTAAVTVESPVTVRLVDAGVGGVPQYSGASCSEPVTSSFAAFAFDVDSTRASALPFIGWNLSLLPLDGGAAISWRDEPVGGVLEDGGLSRVLNAQLAPPRISLVWHACAGADAGFTVQPGAPAGHYRALLTGRILDGDAGFMSLSTPFELSDCAFTPAPPDAGVDAGSGSVADAGGGGASDAGTGPQMPQPGCSTSTSAGLLPLLLLAFAFRARRVTRLS
ncbi:MAG: hypothetical protein QM817_41300 [Archangium sp.]